MKKLFYATKNKYKIQTMKDRLAGLNIELITPYDINISVIDVDENASSVEENAVLKAKAYYDKIQMPIIAGDSALYVEKFDKQPGLFVRRVNGRYLEDDELEEYYINRLNEIGGKSYAYYITGLAIINEGVVKTVEIKEDKFILTSNICDGERQNDALGRLEYDPVLNKYFCEKTEEDKRKNSKLFDKQCIKFILENI